MIAIQVLAGCDMPAKAGVAHDDRSPSRKADFKARELRMRKQVEAGTFGIAQLYPGGIPVDARQLPPLPRPSAVRIPAVTARVAQPSAPETPVHVAFAPTAGPSNGCVYKPVMSDADLDACR